MEALPEMASLREWFHRLRRKYQPRPAKTITYQDGLPPGLEMELLASLCKDQFGRQIQGVRYTHLSGWKSSGAYRLHILPTTGADIYLIFKLANYEHAEIPALRDFPLHPGLPEYILYSQPIGPLADYLPRIYLAEEIQPRISYRYLLEDLYGGYQIARTDDQRVEAAKFLPELHQALTAWNEIASTQGLLQYGQLFSEKLQGYVRARLERYAEHNDSPDLRAVFAHWSEIASLHRQPEFFTQPPSVIHGDANYSNFHISRTNAREFKIVDWEWAGFGTPLADLSALTKSSFQHLEKRGFESYIQRFYAETPKSQRGAVASQQWRLFLWSRLERAMIDAAFLSAQVLDAAHAARINLPRSVDHSLERILLSYRQLAG